MIFKSILIVFSIIQFSVCHPVSSDVPYCRYEYDKDSIKYMAIDCKGNPMYSHMCDNLQMDANNETLHAITVENCIIDEDAEIFPSDKVEITTVKYLKNNTFPGSDVSCSDSLNLLVVIESKFKTTPASIYVDAAEMKWFEYIGKEDVIVDNITMVDPAKLEYFSMKNSSISSYPKDFFKNSTNLKIVLVTSNKIESIDSVNLPKSVKWLDVSKNNISHLSNKSFENVENLQVFSADEDNINHIDPGTFSKLKDMIFLSMQKNHIEEIKKGMLDGLSNLRGIDLSNNKIENIEIGAFEGAPNVSFIKIDKNNISHVDQNTFNGLHRLQYLNLASNPIESMAVNTFANMSQLKELSMSDCKLKSFDFNVFASSWILAELDLSNNQIEHLVKMSPSQPIQNNATSNSSQPQFEVMNNLKWMDSIEEFGGDFKSEDAREFFSTVTELSFMIDLVSYLVQNEIDAVAHKEWKLLALNLTANQLTVVEKDIFAAFKNLNYLYLSQNPITTLYPESFAGLAELDTLEMDGCKLTSIDFGVFAHSPKLKFLDLSHNQLKSIVAVPMPSLQIIYMNDNQLTTLPLQKKDLPELVRLNVQSNKLVCAAMDFASSIELNCNDQQ